MLLMLMLQPLGNYGLYQPGPRADAAQSEQHNPLGFSLSDLFLPALKDTEWPEPLTGRVRGATESTNKDFVPSNGCYRREGQRRLRES